MAKATGKKKGKGKGKVPLSGKYYQIAGIAVIALSLFFAYALISGSSGVLGNFWRAFSVSSFGIGSWLLVLLMLVAGAVLIWKERLAMDAGFLAGMALIFISFETVAHLVAMKTAVTGLQGVQIPIKDYFNADVLAAGGGRVGGALLYVLTPVFGRVGVTIFAVAEMLIGLVLVGDFSLNTLIQGAADKLGQRMTQLLARLRGAERQKPERKPKRQPIKVSDGSAGPAGRKAMRDFGSILVEPEDTPPPTLPGMDPDAVSIPHVGDQHAQPGEYALPIVDILSVSKASDPGDYRKKVDETAKRIEETLASFGIEATVTEAVKGPTVTRYELHLASGIKVNQITNLSDDLAMVLATPKVNILAPIPGRSAVGIDVPNPKKEIVTLGDLFRSPGRPPEMRPLTVGFGKDIAGTTVFADLDGMPHLLIAGATGSGKSGCLNAIIASLLLNARPDEVKMILIDPKQVEFHQYQGLPHLMTPVVTDKKKAAAALSWAVAEMDLRFNACKGAGVKDIYGYNDPARRDGEEAMPFIVVIIDELADLMLVAKAEVEDAICRISQLGRAAGIHLVVATQRPSTDVITGLIKANIPSRIAFAVSTQIDSRVILDGNGAEKLLGKGDMLFSPAGAMVTQRLQGAYVTEKEIDLLVKWSKNQANPQYNEEVVQEKGSPGGSVEYDDELLWEAASLIVAVGKASTSMLQRRLQVGYGRAARIIDTLEAIGVVGPGEGSKPRQVLMTPDEIERLKESG